MSLQSNPLPADHVRDLPTRELALEMLHAMNRGEQLATGNMLGLAEQEYSRQGEPDVPTLTQKLADGWAWLVAHGLIGPHPQYHGAMAVTTAGVELAKDEHALVRVIGEARLSGTLDAALERARAIFSLGDYESACSSALKAVEVEVRRAANLKNSDFGPSLMQAAFRPDPRPNGRGAPGALTDLQAEAGEQVGVMNLFAGAMGALRNPLAHRPVDFDDAVEAAEVIQLADLLLTILRRAERRIAGGNTP